ncbi:MAG: glycosyltransferase family 2 protein [Acetobacteraceae bacterium]|nr:glycosyltransferase family 2 protein [Acetobacteraceae bacterium]
MPVLLAGAAWLGLVLWLLARILRQFRAYGAGPGITERPPEPAPRVVVIIPARDEAANLGPTLAALSAQRYPRECCRILVIDDGSCDDTAKVAEQAAAADPRIRLHPAGRLPDGWLGKPHACWRGARLATDADWLCFMDADVRAAPDLLASAVNQAEREGLDMLSLHPFQELGSFWERLVIPAGMLMIACAKDLRAMQDPASPEAEANGQFILIRRAAYMALGGHAAVRGEVCEDLALARRAKAAGYRLRLVAAEHLARTRMYRDLGSLWEGFAKNAVEIMGNGRRTLLVAGLGALFAWTAFLLPPLLGAAALHQPRPAALVGAALAALGSAVVVGVVAGTARHFRGPMALALLFPIGACMAAALAWHSVSLRRRGHVTWKRRRYTLHHMPPVGMP